MENEIKWEVVEELSDEDGTPNCWAYKIGKANYVYITHNHNDMYDVEHSTSYGESRIVVLKTFKRFSNAKRFAEQWIAWLCTNGFSGSIFMDWVAPPPWNIQN